MTDLTTLSEFAARLKTLMGRRPPDSILSQPEFNHLALALFSLQFQRNPAFARLCQTRGVTPATVQDWRAIPAVPTEAFKEYDFTCLPEAERTRVFHSSGTTAQAPSRHFHGTESLAVYEASLLPWFEHHLLPEASFPVPSLTPQRPFTPALSPGGGAEARAAAPASALAMLLLTPPPSQAPHSSLAHMLDTVRRRWGGGGSLFCGQTASDGAWLLDFERVRAALREAAETGCPVLLLGTAFNFVHLLEYLEACQIQVRLPHGSRIMETGGYKGRSRELSKAELHARLQDRLGVAPEWIVCEYGMCELSSQAYDHQAGQGTGPRRFHFPPWARVRIISPEDGRDQPEGAPGLICVCDLANVWSVLAVQTADLGVQHDQGFELLGRAAAAQSRGCSLLSTL